MKKLLSVLLAVAMIASALALTVSAKDPLGTIVELTYAETAPSMDEAMPDASWGEKIVTVNKNSPNAVIQDYKSESEQQGSVKKDLSFDVYGRWTDKTLYLCFVTPDKDPVGSSYYWRGDGFQMVIVPGINDVSYKNNKDMGWTTEAEFELYDYCCTLDFDDSSMITSDVAEDHAALYYDEKTSSLVVKFEIPLTALNYNKNSVGADGDVFSFALLRVDGNIEAVPYETSGWLEWGNFYDSTKGWNDPNGSVYLTRIDNPATKTANTFKLVGKNSGATTPAKEEPAKETPATTTETPSSWAAEEVNASIALGLVPAELQKSYTTGITRGQLALMLTSLLQKAGVTMPTAAGSASFTDTTDANVLAAANLGIINGYKQADGTYMFKPNNTLKRSEMSAIINRVAKLCGKTTTGFEKEVTFTDTASHWCNSELGYPVHMGIVKGTSATTFSPENTLTIEQTIMMVYRTLNALAK